VTAWNTDGRLPIWEWADDTKMHAKIPIDLSTGTPTQLYRVVIPDVRANDWLRIHARARVTNNVGYNVGVGIWLRYCDVEIPQPRPYHTIGDPDGENVIPDVHHMPLRNDWPLEVPATWPLGHRMSVELWADAHSTAWKQGHYLIVDNYGVITVTVWRHPEDAEL
jgi:hypothetical protein